MAALAMRRSPPRGLERDALASAIAVRVKAARDAEAAAKALASLLAMTTDAEGELAAVREGIERDDLAEVRRAIADGAAPLEVTHAARVREAGIVARLASCKAHREACEAARDDTAYHLRKAVEAVEKAIAPVELLRISEMTAELARLQTELCCKRAVLNRLSRNYPGINTNLDAPKPGSEAFELRTVLHKPFLHSDDGVGAALAPWEALREALRRDPDAELPA